MEPVEAELVRWNRSNDLIAAAMEFHNPRSLPPASCAPAATLAAARWPILSAWRWRVMGPEHEVLFTGADQFISRSSVALEGPRDLAYRGVLPMALGSALLKLPANS